MKAGVLLAVWALEALATAGGSHADLELLVTPDEEIGSLGSRPWIEAAARDADFVLVLEPTVAGGPLKIARKGSGEYLVRIVGRAAHQGVEPERGINAVVEAAHQVLALTALQDAAAGTTVGPNVIRGGTASNVVPESVELRVDVRVWRAAEQRRIERAITGLAPVLDGAAIEIGGGWNRPPMESTALSEALFDRARTAAASLGLDVAPVAWGGSSDANLTAAVGAPTVDGFGPEGAGAHQRTEHVVIDSIPDRLALLVRLLRSLAQPPESWLPEDALALHHARRPPVPTTSG
jgi:glutamate carboxypeptidase